MTGREDGDRTTVDATPNAARDGADLGPGAAAAGGRTIVVLGAGSVGRGFLGQVFAEAGWRVVFVDTDVELVAALRRGSYAHATVSDAGTVTTTVTGCTALAGGDPAVADAVAAADLVATSVGPTNLPAVAASMAAGLARRTRPVDVLLAENLHAAAATMRGLLAEHLAADQLARVGLLETSIGRMIPVPTAEQRAQDPAYVAVEPYRELPYDAAACVAPPPDVPDLVARTDLPFGFFADRKLYVHSLGHCLTAFLGQLLGDELVADAIRRPGVRRLVAAAMSATAASIAAAYGEPLAALDDHVQDLLRRFANRALRDPVERVARDPHRKLAPGDRFLGALDLTRRHGPWAGVGAPPVVVALAVGVHRLRQDDPATDAASFRTHLPDPACFDATLATLARSPVDLDRLWTLADPR